MYGILISVSENEKMASKSLYIRPLYAKNAWIYGRRKGGKKSFETEQNDMVYEFFQKLFLGFDIVY